MRFRFVVLVGMLACVLAVACGPTMHQPDDDWKALEPEITGDNDKDEARWRRELESDPWGDDAHLLTDNPPKTAAEYRAHQDDEVPPLDFVGPPEPPSRWDNMQKGGTTFGRVMFSVLTVLVTLGMMAAPYLMMI
jgi:hypothetical protein